MSEVSRAVGRFFGVLLMAVGGLIALLSGACTLFVGGAGLLNGSANSMIPGALIFGVPVIALGVGVFLGGRSLYRGPQRPLPRITDGLEGLDEP
ncbi:MAG TPA: hypothetical protein VL460_12180 [Caulobacteraceae bacterium]|jgi:hypothetical protein|nr:hypothetical protein [Caulobacteraceae bacterium]